MSGTRPARWAPPGPSRRDVVGAARAWVDAHGHEEDPGARRSRLDPPHVL